ncbi:AI-2E family transporter [Chitinophaga sp. LS1]|uniref:AI-2E family transporter n=1 Tax=Chitinophaga sp. LS1 TaxID=3051176 RepID=UPI002AAB8DF8|nr:AI-2E family transporter [Chitinophaga sp. LS1]WPV66349.1 AI-2E family transporter [Chitinophaga sp. LS1]
MKEIPVSVRRALELLGLFLTGAVIVMGKIVVMPLLMAFFVSLLLLPVFRFFRKLKVPVAIAIFLPIAGLTISVLLIGWLFSNQVGILLTDFPRIAHNVTKHLDTLSIWIGHVFGFSPTEQLKFINEQSNKLFGLAGSLVSGAVVSATGIFLFFGLLPVYIYLIILYKSLFVKFVLLWFEQDKYENVEITMRQIESMVKSYLVGLLIQIAYITLLLGGALALFGIKNSLLIGLMFAFLNLIPYLGALIGNILGVLITLVSSDRIVDILIVLGTIAVVQFFDNNILMPRIVGGKVKLNAFISLVGIIIGGAMTGISGMFLALPVIAVLKIVFDHSEKFKKWGILFGDDTPATKSALIKFKK